MRAFISTVAEFGQVNLNRKDREPYAYKMPTLHMFVVYRISTLVS